MPTPLTELLVQYKAAIVAKDKVAVRRIQSTVLTENQNLVRKLVAKLSAKVGLDSLANLEPTDLEQAGNIGALRAFDRWNPEKGKFSTYSAWWIRKEIQTAVHEAQPVSRSKNGAKPWAIAKRQDAILAKTGEQATAAELGVREKTLEGWRMPPLVVSMDEPRALGNREGHARYAGVSEKIGEMTRHDTLSADRPNAEEQLIHAETAHQLQLGMKSLTEGEAHVISELFLEGLRVRDVAADLAVTEATVETIRDTALAKMRQAVR